MKKAIILTLLSGIGFSCADLVDDLNKNPNNPTSAPYQYALTAAEVGNIVLQTGEASRRAGIFSGQFTGINRQHQSYSEYLVSASDFNSQWRSVYNSILRNAIITEELAQSEGVLGITIGITQILKATALGTATSLWGDIPFDQAGKLEFENPEFESQSVVYDKLQGLLDEAIVNLAAGTGRPPSSTDIYFDGDPIGWTQVAYTLKARYYMHMKDYSNAYTAAQSGVGSDGTSFGANDMQSPHGTANDNANLHYQFFALASRKNDLITSDFFASMIDSNTGTNPIPINYRGHAKTNETARYNYLLQTVTPGIQPNTNVDGFAQIDSPASMVTYAENLLILSEAGARASFATGLGHLNEFRSYMSAGGYLSNPNMADVLYAAYVSADFDAGGIENIDGITPDNALLREIIQERYVTFFGQIEVFNDTRRTQSESAIRVPVTPNTGSEMPQRFLYAQSEIDANTNTPNPIPGFFESTPVNQ
ncbi:MAG: hypothetical protein ACI9P5_002983 [Saprospiraceae bacterium]|jgi:hypothetical protein